MDLNVNLRQFNKRLMVNISIRKSKEINITLEYKAND